MNIFCLSITIYEHLCCYQFFTSRNNPAMNNLVISPRISLGEITRFLLENVSSSKIGGWLGIHLLNFMRCSSLKLAVPIYTPTSSMRISVSMYSQMGWIKATFRLTFDQPASWVIIYCLDVCSMEIIIL